MAAKRKRTTQYSTRVATPTTRDPKPDTTPKHETMPHRPDTIALRVPLVRCTACGCGTMRKGGGTRPNLSSGEMARRWRCAKCGQRFCVFTDATEAEIARHWSGDTD